MPQTQVHYVCVPCRSIMPQYHLVEKSPGSETYDLICKACGGTLLRAPYKWSPPKKNNDRAWKRIAKGEWLWDRRRVQRVRARWPYVNIWRAERRPTHKKGQETSVQRSWPQSGRELGG